MGKMSPMWLIQRMLKLYTGTTTYFGFQEERLLCLLSHMLHCYSVPIYGEGTVLESVAL